MDPGGIPGVGHDAVRTDVDTLCAATNLCETCLNIFSTELPQMEKGTWAMSAEQVHHTTLTQLRASADGGCKICKILCSRYENTGISSLAHDGSGHTSMWRFGTKDIFWLRNEKQLSPLGQIGFVPQNYMSFAITSFGDAGLPVIPFPKKSSYPALLREWIHSCTGKHEPCQAYRQRKRAQPSRVLDVGKQNTSTVKLRVLGGSDLDGPYITLSHKWGTTTLLKLKTTNINSLREHIPLASLTQTFRDAVQIARWVGVRYLWIDSLCIVQDSISDWEKEVEQMGDIYAGGLFNIAATHAENSHTGLFRETDHLVLPVVRPAWTTIPSTDSVDDLSPAAVHLPHSSTSTSPPVELPPGGVILHPELGFDNEIQNSPLLLRGWVHQEIKLTPATLYCGRNQMWWVCAVGFRNESYPAELPFFISNWIEFSRTIASRTTQLQLEANPRQAVMSTWLDQAQQFSPAAFTKIDDRMIALGALAYHLRKETGLGSDVQYLSGVWSIFTVEQLSWRLNDPSSARNNSRVGGSYPTPTWSWTSTNSSIEFDHRAWLTLNRKDLDPYRYVTLPTFVCFDRPTSDKFGRATYLAACRIIVRGVLVPATLPRPFSILDPHAHPTTDPDSLAQITYDFQEELDIALDGSSLSFFLPIHFTCQETCHDVGGLILRRDRSSSTYQRCGFFSFSRIHWNSTGGGVKKMYDTFQISRYGYSLLDGKDLSLNLDVDVTNIPIT